MTIKKYLKPLEGVSIVTQNVAEVNTILFTLQQISPTNRRTASAPSIINGPQSVGSVNDSWHLTKNNELDLGDNADEKQDSWQIAHGRKRGRYRGGNFRGGDVASVAIAMKTSDPEMNVR